MAFSYPPDPSQDLHELFRRSKQRDTVRDLGHVSLSAGDGMLELRDGRGAVIGGLGDLPDGSFGVAIFRNGRTQNLNSAFNDDFYARDARLDQHDRNDVSHQGQLNALRGDITRLDAVDADIGRRLAGHDQNDASHQSQLNALRGDVTRLDGVDADIGRRLGGHDSAINTAQSTANGAAAAARAAQRSADSAQNAANSAQGSANSANSEVDRLRAQHVGDMVTLKNAINKLGSATNTNPWA